MSTSARQHSTMNWMDILWLLFLAGLALLPPVFEIHKQLVLLAFGVVQLGEAWAIKKLPGRGAAYIVVAKIALATLLIDHTGELSINSSYWPIYFLPTVTAAEYFSPLGTLLWTALASAAYCSYLYPALQLYEITAEAYGLLAIRILFFFLAAMVVNRFVVENQRQIQRYRELSEKLADTNRKLEQAQEEARRSERLAALGQMTAGLAHEIRNPLGVIKGSAEMLHQKLGETNPLATELTGYISSETNRLSALVTRFLDFARPLHAEVLPTSISAVLDMALQAVEFSHHEEAASIKVEKSYQPDLPLVPLDEGLCEQAFVNLIQNAYDAMGKAGGILRLKAHSVDGDRSGIEVRIEDSGPGIPTEMKEQMFNPFVTTKKTGVGLGLSIVSRIMDVHHGTIRVETQRIETQKEEKSLGGAEFVMFFPEKDATVET